MKPEVPYHENDFETNQRENIERDLERFENAVERHKYFFVADGRTERILKQK